MGARDPHRFINELDPKTVEKLIYRLESRGKDAVFSRLLDQYLSRLALPAAARVLEIGCGTGVVTRALRALRGFEGTVIGIDQSPALIETARHQAREEQLDRLQYEVGDAHELTFADRSFDAVILHTVISHVTRPAQVLAEMSRVLVKGGTAVVFDGDYASLTFGHEDAELAQRMDVALASATFNNPLVMRSLPKALPEAGLTLTETLADNVSEIGTASYFRSFAETYAPMVSTSGIVPSAEVDSWLAAQYAAMEAGTFFASCNYYTMIATRD